MADDFNYVSYTFDELVIQLQDRLKNRSAWSDTYRSSTGQMIIELFAYVGSLMMYYVERQAEETYMDTAKKRSSVINLSKLVGYAPSRRVSATGVLTFSIAVAHTKNIYIPKGTICQTAGGLKFAVIEDVVLLAGSTSVDANVVQGDYVTVSYVSTGLPIQRIAINDTEVENSHIDIVIDDEYWVYKPTFILSGPEDKVYFIYTEFDDTIVAQFGNGSHGFIPPVGATVLVTYVRSDGVDGNVYSLGLVNVVNSVIFDADGTAMTVLVTNSSLFQGGSERETTDSIREFAPKAFATGDRLVTRADFLAITRSYPGVGDANVWGENEEDAPTYTMFNTIRIALLLVEWSIPGTTFKDALSVHLYTKSMMTVKYEYYPVSIIEVVPVIKLYVEDGNVLSVVSGAVETALEAVFVLGSTARLEEARRYSDVVATIEAVIGVSYCYLDLCIDKDLVPNYDSFYGYGEILDVVPLLPATVDILISGVLVAESNTAGAITSVVGSAYTVTGLVDSITGSIGIDIVEALTSDDIVTARYQTDQDRDIVVGKAQICRLSDVVFTSVAYDR